MRHYLALAVVALTLSSCAAMMDEYRAKNCGHDAGYEHGYNDAQSGKAMDSSFSSNCEAKARETQQGYHEGFDKAASQTTINAGSDGVSFHGGGININVGNRGNKAWVCELSPFTTTYSGFGSTRNEAAQDARNKCNADNNDMHCHNPDCQKAQ